MNIEKKTFCNGLFPGCSLCSPSEPDAAALGAGRARH